MNGEIEGRRSGDNPANYATDPTSPPAFTGPPGNIDCLGQVSLATLPYFVAFTTPDRLTLPNVLRAPFLALRRLIIVLWIENAPRP
jgi:hypothetical protein